MELIILIEVPALYKFIYYAAMNYSKKDKVLDLLVWFLKVF